MKKNVLFFVLLMMHSLGMQCWYSIVPLEQVLLHYPEIEYISCTHKMLYEAPLFQALVSMPNKVTFDALSVLKIPNGRVQGTRGHTLIHGNTLIKESVWFNRYDLLNEVVSIPDEKIVKVSGRVAVIAQLSYVNYFHFINETLGKLALLEMMGIEYDWLYIACDRTFIDSLLTIWGVDKNKIISPLDAYYCVQADELIIPSSNVNTDVGFDHTGIFVHPETMQYVKNKILSNVGAPQKEFSKKVFISRKDGYIRRITNEDEIFALFEPLGFVSYQLSSMTVQDQIALFSNAEIIVGEHGAGFANLLFCNKGTIVIELFQLLLETCMWWVSWVNHLDYHPVTLLDVDYSYSLNWRNYPWIQAWCSTINVPLDSIYPIVEKLKKIELEGKKDRDV